MNERGINICLIREGLTLENTLLLSIDTDKEEITPLYEDDEYIFEHITDAKKLDITELQTTYAKMFLLHNLNIIAFNDKYQTQLLYKLDGTTKEYEA